MRRHKLLVLAAVMFTTATASAQFGIKASTEGMVAEVRASSDAAEGYIRDTPRMEDTAAIAILNAALGPGIRANLRASAIETAWKTRPSVYEKVFGEIMANGETDEKTQIIKDTNKLSPPVQMLLLQRAFGDRAMRVKEEAVKAATKLPDPEKIELYRSGAKIVESTIREKIIQDTGNLDRAGAFTVLDSFKGERDPRVLAAIEKVKAKHKLDQDQ